MEIVEYSSIYNESIKDLLVELQEYIAKIDQEKYNILTDQYKEKYFEKTMSEVKKYEGKIFLAIESNKAIGLIVGVINNDEVSTYDFKAPKRGRITELIVSKECGAKEVGKKLLNTMEQYFKKVGCKGILIDVFAYNKNAQKFYTKCGYFDRNIEMMKKL